VDGTIPPHPDLKEEGYETVYEHRRRLGIQFNYATKWLSPELCRTLSEDECQTWDEAFGKTIETNRKFLTVKGRRELQGSTSTTPDMRVLVILLQWPNHADRELISPDDIELLFNSDEIDEELFPTGSVKRFFDINSYGQFSVTADIVPWVMTDNDEQYYASFGDSGRSPELQNAFFPLLDALDDTGGFSGFDFSPYDQDQDGVIDMTIFLHSGYAAEQGGEDCVTGATVSERIGSFASSSMQKTGTWQSKAGYDLGAFVVASAYRGRCNFDIARLGTLVHEMTHPFGIPDLYDIEGSLNSEGNAGGIGRYDIMVSNPRKKNGQVI
jgi:M6 family metalloprotease-like protein